MSKQQFSSPTVENLFRAFAAAGHDVAGIIERHDAPKPALIRREKVIVMADSYNGRQNVLFMMWSDDSRLLQAEFGYKLITTGKVTSRTEFAGSNGTTYRIYSDWSAAIIRIEAPLSLTQTTKLPIIITLPTMLDDVIAAVLDFLHSNEQGYDFRAEPSTSDMSNIVVSDSDELFTAETQQRLAALAAEFSNEYRQWLQSGN